MVLGKKSLERKNEEKDGLLFLVEALVQKI
jgi:hypothetical protein